MPKKDNITVLVVTSSKADLSDTVEKIQNSCKKFGVPFYPVLTQHAYIDDLLATNKHIKIENYDGKGHSVTIDPSNTVCFARGGVTTTQIGLAILSIFENTGMFIVNERKVMELCSNKLSTALELDRYKISTPRTAFVVNLSSLDSSLKKIGNKFPVVMKTLTGAEGVGVSIIDSYESLKSVLQTLWKYGAEVILQEYLEIKNDVRSLVLDGKVIASAMRGKAPKDFRTNLAQGASGGPYSLSKEEIELVEKAAKVFGCFYVGVDSVISDGKPYIIEMNASPGSGNVYKSYFEGDNGDKITGQKLIDKVVKYSIDRSNWQFSQRESGLIENVEILGVGQFHAKLDTGNESYNVLNADEISEENGVVKFRAGGKTHTKKAVSHVRIRTSNDSTERRPVVEFDIKFRNRTFSNVKFSLTKRHNKKYEILFGMKFLQQARISVNVSKKFALPEEFSNLNNNIDAAFGLLYENYSNKLDYSHNPYFPKIAELETVASVIDFEDSMNEILRVEKSPPKIQLLNEALRFINRKKQDLKEKVYSGYKEKDMQIDKDFNLYLDTMLEELSDQDVAWLLEWVQHDEVDNDSSPEELSEAAKIKKGFKDRYGKKWKSVLYATSQKMSRKTPVEEEVENIDEAAKKAKPVKEVPRGRRKDVKGQTYMDFRGKDKKEKDGDKKGGGEKNSAAGNRFWSYDSTKKGRRKHPAPRAPEQSGETKGKVDGNLKGRFKRYYGKKGERSKNGKSSEAIRAAVKKLIAQGKWPSPAGLAGLKKGWAKSKASKKGK